MAKLTLEKALAEIENEQYHVFEGTAMTVCCLTLKNGFNIIGESCPISEDDFDVELGMKVAKNKAVDKIFGFLAFRAKDEISGTKE